MCFIDILSKCTTSSLQPPNDPHQITRDDLILALRGVLSATPLFAEVNNNHVNDDVTDISL